MRRLDQFRVKATVLVSPGLYVLALVSCVYDAQVLRKDDGDPAWHPIPQDDLELVGEGGATYLRARVYHFTLFACGRRTVAARRGYDQGKHRDKTKVKFQNATEAKVYLVWLPTKHSVSSTVRHALQFPVGAGRVEVGGGGEREVQTAYVVLPSSDAPSSTMVDAHATEMLGLREKSTPERLIVCTIHDEPPTAPPTPYASPSSAAGQPAPAAHSGKPRDSGVIRRVDYYDTKIVRGGERHVLLPERLETGCQKSHRVRNESVVLAHVAMALAGLVAPTDGEDEETKGAPESGWGWVAGLLSRGPRG